MEPKSSLPHSQAPATRPHPETEHTTPWLPRPLLEDPFYRGADKSLARPGRKQTTATEDFEFHISYL
jgi:hypothetical protein